MMTVIKIIFVILLLIPIGMLMRYLLGKLSAEVPAQTDSVEIRSGRKRKIRRGPKATKARTGAASGKADRKVQEKAPKRTDNRENDSYRSRQPKEWSRSDRVPFGESQGYKVPQPGNRKRRTEASPWRRDPEEIENPWRREREKIESPWSRDTQEIENPWRQERIRSQGQRRSQNAADRRKPSDAVRERVAEDSAPVEIPQSPEIPVQEPQPISERKTRKKRSEKSLTKRQLRKNRERARKRDLKKR